ncbi:Putative A-amylase [Rhizopus microsporus]|nr:Putative A-amylase [Rhizopus microsporus]
MGFDAIWISPIPQNSQGGYHGYWATNFSAINSNFGSSDDLKKLVQAAHAKNMYVMLDVVANHVGTPSTQNNYNGYTFNQGSYYHSYCDVNYNDQTSVEQCWLSGLPDLNTENDYVVNTLYSTVSNWISEYGFDGIRIDTVKHVRKGFWDGYVKAAGVKGSEN